ncbi:MAG: hypothetical protein ACKPEN_07025 [Planktothrix sp.]|uniref:hypothetical protein n=1 Tax=Planktothrix sp. TaxID=3088171 RepID=UPI0038D42AA9
MNNQLIYEFVDIDDPILNSLILVPVNGGIIEPEVQTLNNSTHFWMWGDIETEEYLEIVNSVLGDVDTHLDKLELALKNA